jgi:hypothetical protein
VKASDPKRGWIALGTESAATVISMSAIGWWLTQRWHSPAPIVAGSLGGVAIAFYRLLAASK